MEVYQQKVGFISRLISPGLGDWQDTTNLETDLQFGIVSLSLGASGSRQLESRRFWERLRRACEKLLFLLSLIPPSRSFPRKPCRTLKFYFVGVKEGHHAEVITYKLLSTQPEFCFASKPAVHPSVFLLPAQPNQAEQRDIPHMGPTSFLLWHVATVEGPWQTTDTRKVQIPQGCGCTHPEGGAKASICCHDSTQIWIYQGCTVFIEFVLFKFGHQTFVLKCCYDRRS